MGPFIRLRISADMFWWDDDGCWYLLPTIAVQGERLGFRYASVTFMWLKTYGHIYLLPR